MKKINFKALTILLIISMIFGNKVYATSSITSRDDILIDGKKIYKVYDGNYETPSGDGAILRLQLNGKEYIGYCIEIGINVSSGEIDTPAKLYDYFKNVLDDTTTKELIKKITQYVKFGYGSEGKQTDKYYLATQQLIWEAINATGFYKSDFYKNRAGKKYDFKTIDWTIDYSTKFDISSEISNIQSSINQYYKTPSFCSAQNKIELEVGENAEFVDNNNVLSQYRVTCENGVICETNDNRLKIKTTEDTGNYKISFTKSPSGTENFVYSHNGTQGIIVDEGTLESVSCEFGVDTFKNVQTADTKILYIITIGLFCGVIAYIAYYTKKSLDTI